MAWTARRHSRAVVSVEFVTIAAEQFLEFCFAYFRGQRESTMWCKLYSNQAQAVFLVCLFCFLACGFTGLAEAQDDGIIFNNFPTREEFSELPRYCFVQRTHSSVPSVAESLGGLTPELVSEGKKWSALLGPAVWSGLHHYCAALAWLGRYERSVKLGAGVRGRLTERQRRALQIGVEEFRFMEGSMDKKTSVLYPEWALKYGIAYRELGEKQKAVERFLASIQAKKDFAAPYVELSDLLIELGQQGEARKLLELGLKATGGDAVIAGKLRSIQAR